MKFVGIILSYLLKAVFALIGLLFPFLVIVFLVCSFFWPMSETIPERDLPKIVQAANDGDLVAMEVLVRKGYVDSVQAKRYEEQLMESGNDYIYSKKMNKATNPEIKKMVSPLDKRLTDEDKQANAIIQNRVDSISEIWYELGVKHGSYEMASSAKRHYLAKYKKTKKPNDSLLAEYYAQEKEKLKNKRFPYANYGEPLRNLAVGNFEKLGDWMTEPVNQLFSRNFFIGALKLLGILAIGILCLIGPVKFCKYLGKSRFACWPVKVTIFYSILSSWIYAIGRINSGSRYCNLDAFNFFHSGASFGYLNDVCVWASWIWLISVVALTAFACYILRKWWLIPVITISSVIAFFGTIVCTLFAYVITLVVLIVYITLMVSSMSLSVVTTSVQSSMSLPSGWCLNPDGTISDPLGGVYYEVYSGFWLKVRNIGE